MRSTLWAIWLLVPDLLLNARDFMMQDFVRIGKYVWPYRRLFVLSVVCAIIVSVFWALNLSIAFPVVKVLFQNDSLHGYVDR